MDSWLGNQDRLGSFGSHRREPIVDLFSALGVRRGERIALVGGGGKTGLAHRLVGEARERGWTALFTTTTKVLASQGGGKEFVVEERPALDLLRGRLHQEGWLGLAKRWLQEWDESAAGRQQKLGGFTPEEVDGLAEALGPDLLVVEADGSRHRPFKAPAAYEPVVPAGTTLFVTMAGMSVLGRPLNAVWVHRPERVAELARVPLGTPVDPALMATVLAHRQGGLKGAPPTARTVAVLAQAATECRPFGRDVARRLLVKTAFERVVLADLEEYPVGVEVWHWDAQGNVRQGAEGLPRVQAVVLAAGGSRRMGRNKLLLPLGGKPMLAHVVDAALHSLADGVSVVLGADAEAVREALGERPVHFLYNDHWADGQATSLREAVMVLHQRVEGVLFLAGDMPFVPSGHLDRLIVRFRAGGATVIWSGGNGPRTVPAVFGREAFLALMQLEGDVGGRVLADLFTEEVVATSPPRAFFDVDTLEAYEQARGWLEKPRD